MGTTRWPPDRGLRALGQAELLLRDEADMAAFSIYPHLSDRVPDPIPDGFHDPLNDLAARTGRQAAIAESGTSSRTVTYGWAGIPGIQAANRPLVCLWEQTGPRAPVGTAKAVTALWTEWRSRALA